jgi:hypothetical protein
MFGKAVSVEGFANSSIVGNHNVVNANVTFESVLPKLTHSKVNELLKLIYKSKAPAQDEYSLKYPIGISQKTEYNRAYRYRMHFDECADIYIKIDEVMKDFLDGEKIEKKLALLYQHEVLIKDGRPAVGDGDSQLDKIRCELRKLIVNDVHFDVNEYSDEDVDLFCVGLIAYGVSKCKILIAPEIHDVTA